MKDILDAIVKIFGLTAAVPITIFATYIAMAPITFPMTLLILALYFVFGM